MFVFTDESGHFMESTQSEWGIIVVVTTTDKALAQFGEFYKGLFGSEWASIKASQLNYPVREKLLKFIGKRNEIRYTAFVYDYASTSNDAISKHKTGQVKKLEEAIDRTRPITKHQSLIDELELLRNQLRGLSLTDYMKVILIIEAYRKWVQTFAFDYVFTNRARDSWKMKHIFDMQTKPQRFIKMVYSLLYLTTNSLAGASHRVYLPKEWQKDHPLLKRYDTDEGVDLRKFFSNRRCGNDRKDIGLKIPDLISNTLLRSLQRQDEKRWLKILKRINPNRSFVHRRGRAGRMAYYSIGAFPGDVENIEPSELVKKHWKSMREL